MFTVLIAVVALYRSFQDQSRAGISSSLLVLGVCVVLIVVPLHWYQTARNVPPIHDITTGTANPPGFEAVVPLRKQVQDPVEYGGQSVARQQKDAYPDIDTFIVNAPYEDVFSRVQYVAEDMDWRIVDSDVDRGRLEAVDTTLWFGFKDDIVVRVRSEGSSTEVDVRSKSRVGKSDVGTNARRIQRFLFRLRTALEQSKDSNRRP